MIDWETEEKIINLRNNIQYELKLTGMSYTDFNRYIITEDDGLEKIIQVKEVTYEALPNTCRGASERIIRDFTEYLGWEFIRHDKQAWVDGRVLHHIYFKYWEK